MNIEFENKSLILIEERQAVITEIERAIFTSRYELNNKHYTILSTNSISILYSIWEGFIQNLFGLFIDEINNKEIELFSLCDSIIIFCKEAKFIQLKTYPQNKNRKMTFIRNMKTFYSNEVHIIPRVINTESNVGFEVLNRILDQFNLKVYPEHWSTYKYPNPNLKENLGLFLRLRNTVAHGGELLPEESIDKKIFERFKVLTLDLMYDLRAKMVNNLQNEEYRNN